MNKKLIWIFLSTAIGVSGCTLNVGTGNNAANTPANAAPSSPAAAPGNTASTAANTAKSPDAAKPAASGSGDPKSENERIQFAKGATDATLERTIAPGITKMYTFNAKKGQHIWLTASENSGNLDVSFNKHPVTLGEEFKEMLTSSGEWAIFVSNQTDKPLKYKLEIGME